jgi:hypothetical protein
MTGEPTGAWQALPAELREKLAEAARRAGAGPTRATRLEPSPAGPEESLPPCEERTTPYGAVLVRTLEIAPGSSGAAQVLGRLSALENLLASDRSLPPDVAPLRESGLGGAVFLDLETTGLSSTPVFLAGTLTAGDGGLSVCQVFARDYSREKALLHELSNLLRRFPVLVSFNGKTYDLPFLRDRCSFHDLAFEPPGHHLDLLHPARRRWKGVLPDCRLATLEWHLCRRRRFGDIPGAEIPAEYHEFVRRGNASAMRRVFHHNVMDLVTLVEILCEMAGVGETPA